MTTWLARRSRSRSGEDGGSMAVYLTLAVIGLGIAALLVPMIVTSSRVTRSDTSRVHALDAAQAGINVMVGEIRSAKIDNVGSSTRLPCGTRAGAVNSVGPAAYTVTVAYYVSDPVTVPGARPMTCVKDYGTYDPVSDTFTPRYARITAVGTDGAASNGSTKGRTLATTYVLRTTSNNLVGGRIRIYPASSTAGEMCMDAGLATPIAGAGISLQPCVNPPADQQLFAYRSDLTLQLVTSVSVTYPDGLCLSTAVPATAGRTIDLAACGPLGTPPFIQQWSYNDNGGYTAALSTSATNGALSSQCLGAANQNAGVRLTLVACSGGSVTSPVQSWIPSPVAGAGAAQAPQLVNFEQFGRCLDVTNKNVDIDHLIDYPCKQNPFPGAVAFNQKFTTPGIPAGATSATGAIYTTKDGATYCLTSPGTNEGLVRTYPCSSGDARQTWTVYNGSSSLAYSSKYTIVDNTSRCLGLSPAPRSGEQWSSIDVDTCTGASEQKWNATADLALSTLQDLSEIR